MADSIGYSLTYFGILYKRFFKISPIKERKFYLVKVIKDYLETTNYSLEKIAELCDIKSVSYLVTFFKETEKITPSQYRLQNNKLLQNN